MADRSEHSALPNGSALAQDPLSFHCNVLAVKDQAVLAVHGDLDLATAPQFSRVASTACDMPVSALTVELSRVTFLDSSGIQALVTARNAACERGLEFRLESVPRQARKVLELCQLIEYFGLAAEPDRFLA
jgi:anti-sigma B factor antagonist